MVTISRGSLSELSTGVVRCRVLRAYGPSMALGHGGPAHGRPGLAPPDSHRAAGRECGHGWAGRPARDRDAPRGYGLARPRPCLSALGPGHLVGTSRATPRSG